jgi:hypothetical protein
VQGHWHSGRSIANTARSLLPSLVVWLDEWLSSGQQSKGLHSEEQSSSCKTDSHSARHGIFSFCGTRIIIHGSANVKINIFLEPLLWFSGQVPGYRRRGQGFDLRRCQIFWEVLNLERGPLSLVSTNVELLRISGSYSGQEIRQYCHGDLLLWPRDTLHPQKLALTSPTSDSRSLGIVRWRTKATVLYAWYVVPWSLIRTNLRSFETSIKFYQTARRRCSIYCPRKLSSSWI